MIIKADFYVMPDFFKEHNYNTLISNRRQLLSNPAILLVLKTVHCGNSCLKYPCLN